MMYHCCDFNIVLYNNDDGYTNKRSEVMAKIKIRNISYKYMPLIK